MKSPSSRISPRPAASRRRSPSRHSVADHQAKMSSNELRQAREAFLAKLTSENAAVPDKQAAALPEEPAPTNVAGGETHGKATSSEGAAAGPVLAANGATTATAGAMTFTINFNISGASSTFLPQLFGQFMNQRALCETAKQNEFQSARVVEIDSAPVEIDSAPVEIESAPVEIESAPVEIESAPAVEEIEPACVVVDEPEVTSTEPAEVVDLCRSPSPDFSFLQDFSDNEEAAVDDPDEDDFLPSRNIRMPSPPLCPRPKRSLSLSGRSDGKRPMLASNYRFGHSSQQSTSIAVNSLAQAKALASSSASNSARRTSESAMSSTEQGNLVQARAAIASTSTAGSAGRSFKPDNLAMARAAMSSASGSGTQSETTGMASASSASASSSRPLDVSRARAAMVAMAQWRPRTAPAAAPAASAQAAAGAAPAIEAAPAPGAPNNPEPPQRSGICSVCLEKEVEAMLRCKHLFCIPCLQALKARKQPCPKCRAAFRKWDRVYL